MKKRSCPFPHVIGGLKKLESLSDVPRAYAGLPFSSRFLFPLPLSGEFGGLKKLESLSDVPRAYAGLPFLSLLALPPNSGNLVGSSGLEPPTSRLSGARSSLLSYEPVSFPVVLPVSCPSLFGGDDGIRTHDPLLAGQVLSQLSYTPVMGPLPCAGSRGPSKLNNKSGLFRSRRFPWVFFSVKTSSAPLGAPLALFQASLFSIERR